MNRLRGALTLKAMAAALVLAGAGVAAAAYFESDGDDPGAQSPWAGVAPSETAPLVVALCHGANQSWPANLDPSYFEAQFRETAGSSTIADYWRDISHGQFSIEGSIVLDVQLEVPRDSIADRDDDDWQQCRDGIDEQYDIDWDRFSGPVVLKPQTLGSTVDVTTASDTEIRVRTMGHSVAADWPTPPFTAVLTTTGSLWPSRGTLLENVRVTALVVESADVVTFTVERGVSGGYRDRDTSPMDFPADTMIRDVSDILGSTGQLSVSAHTSPSILNHELGHFFGWRHSRRLSTASSDYNDCFDIMSAMSCIYAFPMSVGYAGRDVELSHGVGMTSINLDRRDWISEEQRETVSCGSASHQLRALGLPGPGVYQVRVPMTAAIATGLDSDYLTIELRSQRFAWDRGLPSDAVVLHLMGTDGVSYLVDDDDAGGTTGMGAGSRYEIGGWTIGVDSIDAAAGTADVSLTPPELLSTCLLSDGISDQEPPSTEPPSPTTAPPTTTEAPSTTTTNIPTLEGAACVPGTWLLDSQALVDALATASGAPGSLRHVGGPYTITIEEEGRYFAFRDGWTLGMESPEGSFEIIFDSDESGTMAWDDAGTMTFVETDTTSVLDLTLRFGVGGEMQTFPMSALPATVLDQLPAPELMSGSGSYTCVGDSLQVISDDSGVPAIWTRTG